MKVRNLNEDFILDESPEVNNATEKELEDAIFDCMDSFIYYSDAPYSFSLHTLVDPECDYHFRFIFAIDPEDVQEYKDAWECYDKYSVEELRSNLIETLFGSLNDWVLEEKLYPCLNKFDIIYQVDLYRNADTKLPVLDIVANNESLSEDLEDEEDFAFSENSANHGQLKWDLENGIHEFLSKKGWEGKDIADYSGVKICPAQDGYFKVIVGAELDYDDMFELTDYLNDILEDYDEDAYFDMESSGLASAYVLTDIDE